MKAIRLLMLVIYVFTGTSLTLQAQNTVQLKQVWAKHLRGTGGDEYVNGLSVHPDGSVLLAGRFTGTGMDIDYPAVNTLNSVSANDGFLIQYNASGTVVYKNSYNYNQNDGFNTTVFGLNKRRYALGAANSGSNNFSYANLLISSADSSTSTLSTGLSDNASLVNAFSGSAADGAGFIYGGGHFGGTVNTNLGRGAAVSLTSAGAQDAMLVKHASDRSVRWALKLGGTGNDYIHSVAVAGDIIYAVGRFEGTVDFNPGAGVFNLTATTGISNGFLIKLDTAGTFLNAWVFTSSGASVLQDVKVDAAGSIFLASYFSGTADADLGAGVTSLVSSGGNDAALIKLNPAGDLVWVRKFGGAQDDLATRVAFDVRSNVYLTGYFLSASIDVGFPSSNILSNAGATTTSDGFITGYDSSGIHLCGYRMGGTGSELFSQIAFDANNYLYVAGHFSSPSFQTETYPSYNKVFSLGSGFDAFIIKFNTTCPMFLLQPSLSGGCIGKNSILYASVLGNNPGFIWKRNGVSLTNGAKYSGVANDSLLISNLAATDTGNYTLEASAPGCQTAVSGAVFIPVGSNDMTTGLTHFYRGNGSNADAVSGATASTYVLGGFAANRFNRSGSAMNLVNNFENIQLSAVISNSITSYALWYYPQAYTTFDRAIVTGGSGADFHMGLNPSGELGYKQAGVFYGTGIYLNNNTWYHLVLVKDGTNAKYYLNGRIVFETNAASSNNSLQTQRLLGNGSGAFAYGRVDDLRVYEGRALSMADIQKILLLPEMLQQPVTYYSCPGANNWFKGIAEGNNLSYQWYKNGVALSNNTVYSGAQTDSLYVTSPSVNEEGYYYLRISNAGDLDCISISSDSNYFAVGIPDIQTGLLHTYPFNGNANDQTGANHFSGTGIYTSGSRFNGASGNSLNIASMASPLTITNPIMRDTISVSIWFYNNNLNTAKSLLGPSSGNSRHLRIAADNTIGFMNGSGTFIPSVARLSAVGWNHFVITKAGTNQKIYVNGQLVLNSDQSFSNNNAVNAFSRIGFSPTNTEKAEGAFDDARVFNRILSPADVNGLYRVFSFTRHPSNAVACNGFGNILFTAGLENTNTSQYNLQWKRNGVPLIEGSKYSGVNNDSLTVINTVFADTGTYTLDVISTTASCLKWESNGGLIIMNTATLMADSLRLHLKLNANSTDFSGRNVSVSSNGVTYGTGLFNSTTSAADFNGSSSYLNTTNIIPAGSTAYSFSVWFKTSSFGGILGNSSGLPSANPASSHPLMYVGTDNKLKAKVYNGNTTTISSSSFVNDNQWHHAVLVVSGNTQTLYLDGVAMGSLTGTITALATNYLVGAAYTSGYAAGLSSWYYFQGSIDEVRIYNKAMIAEEVGRLYQSHGFTTSGNRTISSCPGVSLNMPSFATGSNLSYRWKKNGIVISNSANLAGTDSTALVFNNYTASDTGKYLVEVSRNCLTLVSDTISLQLVNPVNIITQPSNTSTCLNGSANFGVSATGTSLQFQWKKAGAILNNAGNIQGATSSSLSISNVTNADTGVYYCVINNVCKTDSTVSVRLTINSGLQILQAPVATTACQNQSSYLFVRTTDPAANYTWRKNGLTVSNSNNDTLYFNNTQFADSGLYRVVVNSVCGIDSTANVFLTVNRSTTIITHPVALTTLCSGTSLSLSVSAGGTNLTYQWKKNGIDLNNQTGSVLSLNNPSVNDSGNYTCVVTGSCGTLTSNLARVNVNQSNIIITQPVAVQNVCVGTNVILFVGATGTNISYLWKRNGSSIGSSNNDTLVRNNVTIAADTGIYTVEVSGSSCPAVTSSQARINVFSGTSITGQPVNKTACLGSPVNLSVTASGAGLTYQWRKNGTDISGETNPVFSISTFSISDTGNYTCFVTGTCGNILSQMAAISKAVPVAISNQPVSSVTICSGNNSYINLVVVATGSVQGYRWYKNGTPVNNSADVSGATSANLQFVNYALGAGTYTCKVFGACDTIVSDPTVFSYYQMPSITHQPVSQTICSGSDVNYLVKATNASTYQWYQSGVPLSNISGKIEGATSDSLTGKSITPSDIGGNSVNIYVVVGNGCAGQNVTSNTVNLSVLNGLTISSQSPSSINGCRTSDVLLFVNTNLSAASYQWYKNTTPLTGQTNDSLLLNNIAFTDSGSYTCQISSSCGNLTSVASVLNVNEIPAPVISRTNNTLTVSAFNSYQWLLNGSEISGATQQSYNPVAPGAYAVRVSNTNGCTGVSADFQFFFTGMGNNLKGKTEVLIYPNPAGVLLNVEADGKWQIEITNIAGTKVKQILMENKMTADIGELTPGVYVLKFTNAQGEYKIFRVVRQ